MEEAQRHVALVPSLGMGHLIPNVELAKRLVLHHNIVVTILIPSVWDLSKIGGILEDLPKGITCAFLPAPDFSDVPEADRMGTQFFFSASRSISSIRDSLKSIASVETTRLVAIIVGPFSTDVLDLAREFDIRSYVFAVSSAMTLSLMFNLSVLDETFSCEFSDIPEKIHLPGCVPIHGRDLVSAIQDRKHNAYKWYLHHSNRMRQPDGILLNSFMGLEARAIEDYEADGSGHPAVYPIGPIVRTGLSFGDEDRPECLQWLDAQPVGSVLFVCFGSGGTLSHEQQIEIAHGLELSGHRFLWAVKSPDESSASGAFTGIQRRVSPLNYLPDGFLERTSGRGLVVASWAPQPAVLSHRATGGFLTHCGWSSVLESIVNGVPMIAWPLFAEQKQNAVMLVEGLKVGLRPKIDQSATTVGRGSIKRVIEEIMAGAEGMKIKGRMEVLKEEASKAMSKEGFSSLALSQVVTDWKCHKNS